MNILVTGGAGFIGSALIRYLIKNTNHKILNIDKLTYAANLDSLKLVSNNKRYNFLKGDILNYKDISHALNTFKPDAVFHLAAESHVDRSISNPISFIETNVTGTANMLDIAYKYWKNLSDSNKQNFRFHHISTDEVFGDLEESGFFTEESRYNPSSPYSASKAGSDHLVRAWHRTYKMPVIITNCSNNYGPYQFPEKLIPLVINKIIKGSKIPVYGDGLQVRDWLYVEDHAEALYTVLINGEVGETYNIGGNNEKTNIEVINIICNLIDNKEGYPVKGKSSHDLIEFVKDRPGHDLRYAIDASKIKNSLSWEPKKTFEEGISETVDWYIQNFTEIDQ
tara:strand:- start:383 stop:1396 length:1014 start_codon:yes stop_codon:yes gene_type:complete